VNIFYLSNNVVECAQMHNDKHTVKMILEYPITFYLHRVLDGVDNVLAKGYMNRSCIKQTIRINGRTLWCRKSKENYTWLAKLLIKLCEDTALDMRKHTKLNAMGFVLFC
jgi:hypothetical protein